jgi:glyoxylase-like metal-dependent hydrolase (beta-lactamase superfamily II)
MNNTYITRIESGGVNCYLIKVKDGFVLIDTGYAKYRDIIDAALDEAGCDTLNLIILTHGDFDHVGNCAYLRKKFDCGVAMHTDDVGMVEKGDMFWNREMGRAKRAIGKLFTLIMRIRLDDEDMFSPDIFLKDRQYLTEFGFDATVHHLPGHSKGSIGLLTADGDLFCGDVFTNVSMPKESDLLSNRNDYIKSLERIQSFDIQTVYPGHGLPFHGKALSNIFQEVN